MLMNKELISVVLVDDHPVVMEGLRALLEKNISLRILAGFTTGKETLDFLQKQEVDVVLLDISLPDMSGMDLCLKIKRMFPRICILAISNHDERSMISGMIQNGVSGYLLKNSSSEEISHSIQQAIEGHLVLSEEVQHILAKGEISKSCRPKLTRREKEVLKLVAEGMTNTQIAEKLFISPLTVETHRRNLNKKFDVSNTAALIKLAMEQKLI